jgi:hypothetical protein
MTASVTASGSMWTPEQNRINGHQPISMTASVTASGSMWTPEQNRINGINR